MNKVDFPIGVELPLRGGGVAVLYEFFENRWYGRMKAYPQSARWVECTWLPNGSDNSEEIIRPGVMVCSGGRLFDILPFKRKAWVVWRSMGEGLFTVEAIPSREVAELKAAGLDAIVQEITEP